MILEAIRADLYQGGPMTGNEDYPVICDSIGLGKDDLLRRSIFLKFKGLPLMGGCTEKARIANCYIMQTRIVYGSISVLNDRKDSTYGHNFNPPFEMHAWLIFNNDPSLIIDFALPGLIMRGISEKDEYGPFLTGREPAILGGGCPDWINYTIHGRV